MKPVRTRLQEALLRELDAAKEALREVRDLIEGYVDVKNSDGGLKPNAAMHAVMLIDKALGGDAT